MRIYVFDRLPWPYLNRKCRSIKKRDAARAPLCASVSNSSIPRLYYGRATCVPCSALLVGVRHLQQQPIVKRLACQLESNR